MTRQGRLGVVVVLLVALGVAIAWFFHSFERRDLTFPVPARGEATWNRLFALKLSLRGDGQRVEARRRIVDAKHPLGARDTVLLLGDPAALSPDDVEILLDFAFEGGHVVVEAPGAGGLTRQDTLLTETFGVGAIRGGDHCLRLQPLPETALLRNQRAMFHSAPEKASERESLFFCYQRFPLGKGQAPLLAWRDADGYAYTRFAYGKGSVDIVASLDFATNQSLGRDANRARFVRQLLAPNWNAGTFHLIFSTDMPPLWRLLLEQGWQVLLPLLVALLGWLWMRAQRFGPALPAPAADRRSLLEHVQASGEHLYRYGRAWVLHAALRERVLARLRRRDPVAAALEGATQAAAIAQRTGLHPADVERALQAPRPGDARDFRQRISALIALGRRL